MPLGINTLILLLHKQWFKYLKPLTNQYWILLNMIWKWYKNITLVQAFGKFFLLQDTQEQLELP